MIRVLLCVITVTLCVSVVNAVRRNFTTETRRSAEVHGDFDPRTFYKSNCEECHGSAAEKRFNPDSPEGQMIDSILNGAKAEGSRDMPAYAEKGIDESKAKTLLNFMKSIRE